MSTTSTPSSTLDSINTALQLGLAIGQLAEPAIVGIVKGIKALLSPTGDITYEITVQVTGDKISAMISQEQADLAVLNAELARLASSPSPAPAG